MNKYGILAGIWGVSTLTGVVLVATNNGDIGSAIVTIATTGALIGGVGFGINDFLRYQKSTQKITSDPIGTNLDNTTSNMEQGVPSKDLKELRSETPTTGSESESSESDNPMDRAP